MTPYDFCKNNVKITVFDTPGLADDTGNDEKYLEQIKKKITAVDLFLFCFDMTSIRFRDDDARTIKKVTTTFGRSLWDHALVVLTFANRVQPSKDKVTEKDFFQQRMLLFRDKICKVLDKEGVDEKALNDLPFVPAGEWMKPALPDRNNWLTVFWIEAFKRINRNAKAAFLLANIDRFIISFGGHLSDEPRGEGERYDECSDEETFVVLGSLEKSSPVISTSEGKYHRKILERIKTKEMKSATISNSDTLVDDKYRSTSILRRGSALVSAEVGEQFRAQMRKMNVQGPGDEKRAYHCETVYSLPPSYDEAVRMGNPVPLPMDESSSQELFKEMIQEALHNCEPGVNAGVRVSRSIFGNIYAKLFWKTIEFIKNLLRRKGNR